MREILFRGKDIVGNWYAGNLAVINQDFHNGTGTIKAGSYISNECGSPFAYQIRPETVGQFTGLLDKTGKKIFEGDIVERDYNDFYDFARYVVVFEDGAFAERCVALHSKTNDFKDISRGGYCRSSHITKEISCGYKIIGNIQDNPELLS